MLDPSVPEGETRQDSSLYRADRYAGRRYADNLRRNVYVLFLSSSRSCLLFVAPFPRDNTRICYLNESVSYRRLNNYRDRNFFFSIDSRALLPLCMLRENFVRGTYYDRIITGDVCGVINSR